MRLLGTYSSKLSKNIIDSAIKQKVVVDILKFLKKSLSKDLKYHCFEHTLDVLTEALSFAEQDGLAERDMQLIAVACAFHDSGFVDQSWENEIIAAKRARTAMLKDGSFSNDEISLVEMMILDTRLIHTPEGPKQFPTTKLSPYLLDADLSNIGREDFFDKTKLHYSEVTLSREKIGSDEATDQKATPDKAEENNYYLETAKLLKTHEWYTETAKALREVKKQENIAKLTKKINKAKKIQSKKSNVENRTQFLVRLPLVMNSSSNIMRVLNNSLEHLTRYIDSETATVFIKSESTDELTFWAMKGKVDESLQGKSVPAGEGIAGWVLEKQRSIKIDDAQNDKRFFSRVDDNTEFSTRQVMCVPLTVKGSEKIGVLQIINNNKNKPFTDEDLNFVEQFSHFLAISIDNHQLTQKTVRYKSALKQLNARKSEMLRVLAHELKTPLSIIQSSADIICSGTLKGETLVKIGKTLINGTQRFAKITAQLNNVAFLSQTKIKPNIEPVPIEDLLKKVADNFQDVVTKRDISLYKFVDNPETLVKCDFGLILIMLQNLVSNAIRFTPNGGAVRIEGISNPVGIDIIVKDTGIGIPKDQQELIFEKFYEVASAMNHSSGTFEFKSGGLGLGLAAAKSIAEAHNTSIKLTSELEKGSEFLICLPIYEIND